MNKTKEAWKKVSDMSMAAKYTFGPINTTTLLLDAKHIAITLSRYKFSAKMMKKCNHIIEIGCGEGIGIPMLVTETLAKITAIDFDELQINYAKEGVLPLIIDRVEFICQDLICDQYKGIKGDGLVCLDVIEHIHPDEEFVFLENCVDCIMNGGIAVIGTPNKYAEQHASARSQQGHINLFDPDRFILTLEKFFSHVFLFSMNDEMVHTGFYKMAHYLMALCIK